jgi:hypothetical protein
VGGAVDERLQLGVGPLELAVDPGQGGLGPLALGDAETIASTAASVTAWNRSWGAARASSARRRSTLATMIRPLRSSTHAAAVASSTSASDRSTPAVPLRRRRVDWRPFVRIAHPMLRCVRDMHT